MSVEHQNSLAPIGEDMPHVIAELVNSEQLRTGQVSPIAATLIEVASQSYRSREQ